MIHKFKVVMVDSIDPDVIKAGGTRSYILNLINYLEKNKIKTVLLGFRHNNQAKSYYPFDFFPIVSSPKISSYKFLIYSFIKALKLKIPKSAIIHTHRPDYMLPFVLFYQNNKKICTLHGIPFKAIRSKKGCIVGTFYGLIEKYTLKRLDTIISVDEETKNFYTKKYPWISDRIIVIPVGVDTGLFRYINKLKVRKDYQLNESDKVIVYAGRMEKEKGIDLLLRSFKNVKEEIPNCKLMLVGNGRQKIQLKNLSAELKLNDVIFIDTVEHSKIPEILNCADVFALCSIYEGMPTIVLESLACGIPIVSTDVGDVHKIVKNAKTGYLVKLRNEEEISSALKKVIQNSDSYRENCIGVARQYSWEKVAKRITEVYNEIQYTK